MSNLYNNIKWDNVDGGVWKQGFDIKYPTDYDKQKKLHIFVIPHSHNDPGWIMTYEEYFRTRTKNILNTIVTALSADPKRKFIWAETSYLFLWWREATEQQKTQMKNLIVNTKQLEIVTGGWVMNDEANSFYYAMIEQMIEGHEWLKHNIDPSIKPSYGWSIDPFGYSPTMPYLLKQMGFKAMLIQRVHYRIKKYMAETNKFEFFWKQNWQTEKSKQNDIFCHVMPFYSYDIPHTCGPDPKICCQFDFERASGTQINCPWGIQPKPITPSNVEERASALLDQYRKKSQLYGGSSGHNVLLIPLGDDFRYQDMNEAEAQYKNYETLMEFMNSKSEWNVEIKFGTLSDYFEKVAEQFQSSPVLLEHNIKTLSGDFFTYADRDDHYWSGYYTSRPFFKRLDRIVEHYLRSAEIIFSFNNLKTVDTDEMNNLYKQLLTARRHLGLFQHHDGVTGTSKTNVVIDYANKLYESINFSKNIIETCAKNFVDKNKEIKLNIDDLRSANKGNNRLVINFDEKDDQVDVVIYNSNSNIRYELVALRVNVLNLDVYDGEDNLINDQQVSLVWINTESREEDSRNVNGQNTFHKKSNIPLSCLDFDDKSFELIFNAKLEPLSLTTFKIKRKTKSSESNSNKIDFYFQNEIDDESIEKAKHALESK
jgi:alpha-mannosidase II